MTRKLQNTMVTGGRCSGGHSLRPRTVPFQSCVRISEPSFGISTVQSTRSAASSGIPNRISGAPAFVSKWPSIAAIFAGWCSSVLSPWKSPVTICSGATIAAIHIAIENISRAAGLAASRSRCRAPTAPTTNAVVR